MTNGLTKCERLTSNSDSRSLRTLDAAVLGDTEAGRIDGDLAIVLTADAVPLALAHHQVPEHVCGHTRAQVSGEQGRCERGNERERARNTRCCEVEIVKYIK